MSRILVSSLAALSAFVILAPAAQAMPVGGSFQGRVTGQTPLQVSGDAVKVRQTATGTNSSPGTPLDGASVTWDETLTLNKGQGTVDGVITLTTAAGTSAAAYQGAVRTDPQGRVTAKGRYKDTDGSGAFAGKKGSGTFSVAYSSKTDFAGGFKGNVTLPNPKTSRR